MYNEIQFKANSGQVNIDQAEGIVECFVAGIGNKDSVGDIVLSGAFSKSLMRRKPRVVWGHNWNDPIGKVLEIYEVPPSDPRLPAKMKMAGIGGLFAKVQFNLNSEKGREAFANVAFFGVEQEWSIGYKTLDAIFDNTRQANLLREVELYEVSPVLHGANQLTGTISVKSDEEKMHMMGGMGMPSTIVIARPEDEGPQEPRDPFAMGIAQPLSDDRRAGLQQELVSRTGGPIHVLKATESSVVFMKPGRGLFRLSYYFDGEQFMFGKPEPMGQKPVTVVPSVGPKPNLSGPTAIPGISGKPNIPSPAMQYASPPPTGDASLVFGTVRPKGTEKSLEDEIDMLLEKIDSDEKMSIKSDAIEKLNSVVRTLQEIIGVETTEKSELLIECAPEHAFEAKQLLDPVFEYHQVETLVTENGILITSDIDLDAYQAIETATKSLFGRIGRRIGPGGPKKGRRATRALTQIDGVLDPKKRRDVDGDGMIFDGTWREMPAPAKPAMASGLQSRRANTVPTAEPKLNVRLTRTQASKMLDGIKKLSGSESEGPLKNLLDEIERRKYIGDPNISPSMLDSALEEISKRKSNGEAVDKFLEDALNEMKTTGAFGQNNARSRAGRPTGAAAPKKEGQQNFAGYSFEKVKPEGWDLMSLEDKENWLATSSSTANLATRDRDRLLAQVYEEMDRRDRRTQSRQRAAGRAASAPAAAAAPKPEAKPKAKPEPKASPQSDDDLTIDQALLRKNYASLTDDEKEEVDAYEAGVIGKLTERLRATNAKLNETGKNDVAELVDGTLSEIDNALGDGATEEAINDAQDAIAKLLKELNTSYGPKPKKPKAGEEGQEVKPDKISSAAGRFRSYFTTVNEALDKMLARRASSADRGDEGELDLSERAVSARVRGFDETDIPNRFENSLKFARSYQDARSRRKTSGAGMVRSNTTPGGLRSDRGKVEPRTEIIAEATWWKKIEDSLPKEIREAKDKATSDALTRLSTLLKRQESGKTGSRRTNVGTLNVTQSEADSILDAVMTVLDRQIEKGGSRGEIFAELLEKIAQSSMSTFIEKATPSAEKPKRN